MRNIKYIQNIQYVQSSLPTVTTDQICTLCHIFNHYPETEVGREDGRETVYYVQNFMTSW